MSERESQATSNFIHPHDHIKEVDTWQIFLLRILGDKLLSICHEFTRMSTNVAEEYKDSVGLFEILFKEVRAIMNWNGTDFEKEATRQKTINSK